MNGKLNKMEEDLPEIVAQSGLDENHAVKVSSDLPLWNPTTSWVLNVTPQFLRDVKRNIENFRELPSDLQTTTAAIEEEVLMLKHALLDLRRSSIF